MGPERYDKRERSERDTPDPPEMRDRFGWQDDDEVALYDEDGNRVTEEEWRRYLARKREKRLADEEKGR